MRNPVFEGFRRLHPGAARVLEVAIRDRQTWNEPMTRPFRHIFLPALAPAAFFLTASTPVEVLGCFNRGLLALSIALASVIVGLVFAIKARRSRRRGDAHSHWWALSALILAIPPAALLVLA